MNLNASITTSKGKTIDKSDNEKLIIHLKGKTDTKAIICFEYLPLEDDYKMVVNVAKNIELLDIKRFY